MLDVTILESARTDHLLALNDAVWHRGENPRMMHVNISIDGKEVISYTGDGFIISTPTGSTAHSVAAGGAIVAPDTDAIELTWICPQSMRTRPLIISGSSIVDVQLVSDRGILTLDGQVTRTISDRHSVTVRTSKKSFNIVRNPNRGYFDILREKLDFGGLPGYQERFSRTDDNGSER
jgi:NAD+ kinase